MLTLHDRHVCRRTQLIGDTNLTKAQQNILAGGGQLETGIVSDFPIGPDDIGKPRLHPCHPLDAESDRKEAREETSQGTGLPYLGTKLARHLVRRV